MATSETAPVYIRLFRTLSAAGIFIGAGGIVISSPQFFWLWAAFLWMGLLALILDLRYEFRLKRNRWIRRISIAFVLILLASFSLGIAFYPNRLAISSISYEGQYKSGEQIYGITWSDELSDMRLFISNPTGIDFEHLDFLLHMEELWAIKDQKAITSIPVTFIPQRRTIHVNLIDPKTGKKAEQDKPIDYYNEVRVLCDRLPKHSELNLIFAVTAPTPTLQEGWRTGKYMFSGAPRLWMRGRPKDIKVTGEYARINRTYDVAVYVPVKRQ